MNPEVDPAMIIRHYVWAVLSTNDPDTWNKNKYGGLNPIVPVGEEPELAEFNGPHIIYVHVHTPSNGPRSNGTITFQFTDSNIRRLNKTMNTVRTALDRDDESARDINRYSSSFVVGLVKPFLGLRFGWVNSTWTEGPVPPDEEGGRAIAMMDIDYEFYVDYDVVTAVLP